MNVEKSLVDLIIYFKQFLRMSLEKSKHDRHPHYHK